MAKHVCQLRHARLCGVLLEQKVEALGRLVTALEDRAVLQAVWVTAPAIKDVVIIPCHGLHEMTESRLWLPHQSMYMSAGMCAVSRVHNEIKAAAEAKVLAAAVDRYTQQTSSLLFTCLAKVCTGEERCVR